MSNNFYRRCTSAYRGIEIACRPSVCLPVRSVGPSVCDVGGSGSHRLEILETNCTDRPNTFALRSPKAIHLIPGEHGEIWGRLEVGWKKVACWSTKATISLKRVKIEEKLLWSAYRKSQTLFRTVPSPTPTASRCPRLGVRNPTPKLQSLLSQERLKIGTSNLADIFTGIIRTQAHEKFRRQGSVSVSRDGPIF